MDRCYIYKRAQKQTSIYRPISLTCISCKVAESLIRDHIMDYFLCNNLFSDSQYGFINKRSTEYSYLNYSTIGHCIRGGSASGCDLYIL